MSQHYANAFTTDLGHCFRFVNTTMPGARGSPRHCREPVVIRGTFTDRGGRRHRVDSCSDHSDELATPRPLTASVMTVGL
jgi:hypothetical protein